MTQSGREPFAKGTWDLELSAAYVTPIRFSDNRITHGTAGLGYYFADHWSANIEFVGYAIDQVGGPDTTGFGGNFILRWHLFTADRSSFYFDGCAGYVWSGEATPPRRHPPRS